MLDAHDAGSDGEGKRIWALLMLELWHTEVLDPAAAGRPAALAA
jgi:hypothetical protein